MIVAITLRRDELRERIRRVIAEPAGTSWLRLARAALHIG
jgi:hypothetical protein